MAELHEFKCDGCDAKVKAVYNREHYLPPPAWVVFFEPNSGLKTNIHLCGDCKNSAINRPRAAESREAGKP